MTTIPIDTDGLLEAFLSDGRVTALSIPYIAARHGYTMTPDKGGGWLLTRNSDLLWVRKLGSEVDFSPSVAKGAGRSSTSVNWMQGLERITGFLVFDAAELKGGIHTWQVSVEQVKAWKQEGILDAKGAMKRADWFERLTQVG